MHCNSDKSRWAVSLGATLLALGFAYLPAPALAQAGCTSDATITFRDEVAGVVTLNDARVRDVTGNNNDDLDIGLNLGGIQTGQVIGTQYRVDSIDANDFPSDASALRAGFNRNVNRFWEVNYSNGQYVFANRGDLVVDVTFTVAGDQAISIAPGNPSAATLTPEQRAIRVAWYGGGNSLRRLQGTTRFRYSDFDGLGQPGIHRANLTLCVEVSGF